MPGWLVGRTPHAAGALDVSPSAGTVDRVEGHFAQDVTGIGEYHRCRVHCPHFLMHFPETSLPENAEELIEQVGDLLQDGVHAGRAVEQGSDSAQEVTQQLARTLLRGDVENDLVQVDLEA
jgi:hypothetical protein